jgi:hypothetical protein
MENCPEQKRDKKGFLPEDLRGLVLRPRVA